MRSSALPIIWIGILFSDLIPNAVSKFLRGRPARLLVGEGFPVSLFLKREFNTGNCF